MDSPESSPVPPPGKTQRPSQTRPAPIRIPSLSGRAVTARRLLDSADLFLPGTPVTPSPPPSSRATSASFFENSDESTLSLPDASQGPHPRIVRGWTAFTNLSFQRDALAQDSTEATETTVAVDEEIDEEVEEIEPPTMNKRRTTELCGLCFTTRLIGGRQYCAKCTKQYNVTKGKRKKILSEEEPKASPTERTPEELYMLRLWHGEMPEPCGCRDKDYTNLDNEVFHVESDMEEGEDDDYYDENEDEDKIHEEPPNKNDNDKYGFSNDDDLLMVDAGECDNSISTEDQNLRFESDGDEMDVDEQHQPRAMLARRRRWTGKKLRGLLPEFRPYRKV